MPTPGEIVYGPRGRGRGWNEPITPEKIITAYEGGLGRTPSQEEIDVHMRNPGGYRGFVDTVAQSEEGRARRVSPRDLVYNRPAATDPATATTTPFSRDERDKLQWSNVGQMSGFEVGSDYGGDVKARNSMKNTFGRIASRYESSPDGVRQLFNDPDFKRAFPNAKLVDHATDPKIDFGGQSSDFESGVPVGIVDVLASSGARGWQWLDESNAGGGTVPVASTRGPVDWRAQPMPQPIYNDDGTVSIRVSPDAYRELAQQGYGRPRRRRRIADLVPGAVPVTTEAI